MVTTRFNDRGMKYEKEKVGSRQGWSIDREKLSVSLVRCSRVEGGSSKTDFEPCPSACPGVAPPRFPQNAADSAAKWSVCSEHWSRSKLCHNINCHDQLIEKRPDSG